MGDVIDLKEKRREKYLKEMAASLKQRWAQPIGLDQIIMPEDMIPVFQELYDAELGGEDD